MIKVKICGNRSIEDLQAARFADAVGFILATPESSRNISEYTAERLFKYLLPFQSSVLVTTETSKDKLKQLASKFKPDYLQVHSELSGSELSEIRKEVPGEVGIITLVSVGNDFQETLEKARSLKKLSISAILLDSYSEDSKGGTGKTHDWELSRKIRDFVYPKPVILAGGLNPSNVLGAINKVRPYAVDVASGVEDVNKKSEGKVMEFIKKTKST